jgi:aconitate hydratase
MPADTRPGQNFSENLLIGAINAENGLSNRVINAVTGEWDTIPNTAR